ncbi:restriction endonuclease subunit S [Anabaena sp. 4-3]|uniref:restriction endonuclease subunit S n=1 Tax=Anabaena sp. 4-3 TaxID=1811979 RepID=UPI0008311A65|nr:restriction endonuclease subunit S [Anabaena sp. 4-3]
MSKGWDVVNLEQVIKHRKEFIEIDDFKKYKRCRVKLHAQGIELRDIVQGAEIKTKKQQICKTDDLLVAEIDAKIGGFGIVPTNLDGAIVSSHYFLFEINELLLDIKFLDYFIRTPAFRDQVTAQGSTNYAAIRPNDVLGYIIPLPPLEEQRRIVARIEELVGKLEEVRSLRQKALEETEALLPVESTKLFSKTLIKGHLSDVLLEKPRNGWSARCDNMPEGTPILSLGAVTGFSYRQTEFKRTSEPVSLDAHYWLKPGDLLITRSNTPELVGHAAIYNGSPYPCIYPDLMMRLEIDEFKANKQFVHHWLACKLVRDYIKSKAKGTSPTMKKISQEVVMNIPFPSDLSISEQCRIVTYLDELRSKVDAMKGLREEAIKELDALLPSILDKAFKGEL